MPWAMHEMLLLEPEPGTLSCFLEVTGRLPLIHHPMGGIDGEYPAAAGSSAQHRSVEVVAYPGVLCLYMSAEAADRAPAASNAVAISPAPCTIERS